MWVFLVVPFDWNGRPDMDRVEVFRSRETATRIAAERNLQLASLNDRELDHSVEVFECVTED